MARNPDLWFRKQTGYWYTTIDGEQIKLSKDKTEARRMLYELLAGKAEKAQTILPGFRKIADLYLEYCQQTQAHSSYINRKYYLARFLKYIGKKKVADLRPYHVSDWMGENPQWNETSRATIKGYLLACLNWAVDEGHLKDHPLVRMKVGAFRRRERILTTDEKNRIREAIANNQDLSDFILALELTGARPFSEMARVTADMIHWETGVIPLNKHKNAKKGKKRTIYLTPALETLLQRKVKEHPNGPLFRTRRGNPWTSPALCWHLRRLEEDLQIPPLVTYSWRHTFITDALAKGLTADLVAELVGNSPQSVARFYSHLESKRETLKDAARKALE
jgi:integrase